MYLWLCLLLQKKPPYMNPTPSSTSRVESLPGNGRGEDDEGLRELVREGEGGVERERKDASVDGLRYSGAQELKARLEEQANDSARHAV